MRIDILTVLPELLHGPLDHSIIKRARSKSVADVHVHNIRDYSQDKHRRTDDYSFGGDAGMVMTIGPIFRLIEKLKSERDYDEIIYTSPDGEIFEQKTANRISLLKNIIILCGHYKGVDQRVRDHLITKEISIGNFVMTGGEIAAAAIVDSIVRLIPGAMSDETSALSDSFQDNLLAPPVYTRPSVFNNWEVPEVLLSGNFQKIKEWQMEQSLNRTEQLRPNLLKED